MTKMWHVRAYTRERIGTQLISNLLLTNVNVRILRKSKSSAISREFSPRIRRKNGSNCHGEKLFLPRRNGCETPRDSVEREPSPKAERWKSIATVSGCPPIEQMSRMLRLELFGLVLLACTQILTEHRSFYDTVPQYGYSRLPDVPERTREVRVKQGRLRGIVVQPRTAYDLQLVDVFRGERYNRK